MEVSDNRFRTDIDQLIGALETPTSELVEDVFVEPAQLSGSGFVDLTEASIRKALRSEALQHPATLLPFALAVLALADLLIFELAGFGSVVVLIAALLGAGVSFFWIYSIRHERR